MYSMKKLLKSNFIFSYNDVGLSSSEIIIPTKKRKAFFPNNILSDPNLSDAYFPSYENIHPTHMAFF